MNRPHPAAALQAVEEACSHVQSGQATADTLRALNLLSNFPYLEHALVGESFDMSKAASHGGVAYLSYVSSMNQLVIMATQIYHDACAPENHKYMAHQLALLYQCLNHLQGDTKPIRRLIEKRFDDIKAVTESNDPRLDVETSAWLQEISWLCREEIKACPPYVHKRVDSVVCHVRPELKRTRSTSMGSPRTPVSAGSPRVGGGMSVTASPMKPSIGASPLGRG